MKTPLRIAICEDVREDAVRLKELVELCSEANATPVDIQVFEGGEDFLAAAGRRTFHLVFMDIYLGSATGIEAARELRKNDKRCQIVFTTQSTAHALDGYGVDALQYLIKPDQITRDSIEKAIERTSRLQEKTAAEVCTVVSDGKRRDIPLSDIMYAEAFDKQCHIHIIIDGKYETVISNMKFDALEAMLPPPRFLRSHRSYIVNLEHAAKIRDDIIMTNGDIVYIRRGDRTKCEIALNEWRLSQVDAGDQ